MPLEERIVLDAVLLSQLMTFNINAGDSVDLSGPGSGWFVEVGPPLTNENATLMISGGSPDQSIATGNAVYGYFAGGISYYDYQFKFSSASSVQFNTVGSYSIYMDFADSAVNDLQVAVVNVAAAPLTPTFEVTPVGSLSGVEGTSVNNVLLANVLEGSINTDVEIQGFSSDNPEITLSGVHLVTNPFNDQIEVRGNVSYIDNGTATFSITLFDTAFGSNYQTTFTVGASASNAPYTIIPVPAIIVQEGQSLNDALVAQFTDGNPNSQASDFSAGVIFGVLNGTDVKITKGSDGVYSVTADLSLGNVVVNRDLTIIIRDQPGGVLEGSVSTLTPYQITDAPLTVGDPLTILADQGVLFNGVVGSFINENPNEPLTNYKDSMIQWGDGTSSLAAIVSLGGGAYEVRGSHTFALDPNGLVGTFTIKDGAEGLHNGSFNIVSSAPVLVADSAPNTSGIEGQLFNDLNLISFTSANPNAQLSDFTFAISLDNILPNGDNVISLLSFDDLRLSQDALGVFHLTADLRVGVDPSSITTTATITDIHGSQIVAIGNVGITQAPKTLGPMVSADLLLGPSYVKIGSFTDANPFEPAGDYVVFVDNDTTAGGNGGAVGVLVNTGAGTYDVYADLNYSSSGLKHGDFIIFENSIFGGQEAGSLISGTFEANVRPNQLLWGVDENTGQLFSVADYAIPGAESRVTLYGQLHTANGTLIGSNISAFTIDGADPDGHNAAYIAISKPVAGINTFSIGVIADINDLSNNTVVTLFTISGIKFNLSKDSITGLAVDPITGNLMGVVVRNDGSPAALFVIDKNTLGAADHVAKAYTLGKMVGKDDLGDMRISKARDLAFDGAGNLFVTDAAQDKLYRIDAANGEILGLANANVGNGLSGNPNIEALAWDPLSGQLIGANSVAGVNDLIGLAVDGGPSSLDAAHLQNLQDIQGMAFLPQFDFRSGQDLGVLVDANNTDVDYSAGDGPVLLLHNVELVTFGEYDYAGVSLTVDISDNADGLTDFLSIKNGDGIKVVNGEVRFKNLWIGTIDTVQNGQNGNALTIHFNANAGEKAIEHLMQRITYMNTAQNLILGDRVISFILTDSLGAIIGYTTVELEIESDSYSSC